MATQKGTFAIMNDGNPKLLNNEEALFGRQEGTQKDVKPGTPFADRSQEVFLNCVCMWCEGLWLAVEEVVMLRVKRNIVSHMKWKGLAASKVEEEWEKAHCWLVGSLSKHRVMEIDMIALNVAMFGGLVGRAAEEPRRKIAQLALRNLVKGTGLLTHLVMQCSKPSPVRAMQGPAVGIEGYMTADAAALTPIPEDAPSPKQESLFGSVSLSGSKGVKRKARKRAKGHCKKQACHKCQNCGRTATKCCKACDDNGVSVSYCSKECRKVDWQDHKHVCWHTKGKCTVVVA